MDGEPWFIEHPEWLEHELQSLAFYGAEAVVDEVARSQGWIRLHVEWPVPPDAPAGIKGAPQGETISLVADYPDEYPSFRPRVRAPEVRLPRHVHPRDGGLCLLDRPTRNWNPEWSLAVLLREQLPKVLRDGSVTDPDTLMASTEEQAEPQSGYYPFVSTAPVLVDDSCLDVVGSEVSGRIEIGLPRRAAVGSRMAAVSVRGGDGELSSLQDSIADLFPVRTRAAWYRLPKAPPPDDPAVMYEWVLEALQSEGVSRHDFKPVSLTDGKLLDVIGVVFEEEREPGVLGLGLAFLVRVRPRVLARKGRPTTAATPTAYVAPVERVSASAYAERVPPFMTLQGKTVCVVGLGSLGAPLGIELARAGVGRIRPADFDVVEAPTTVRWPMGVGAVGMPKVSALRDFIDRHYPFTTIEDHDVLGEVIGEPRKGPGPSQMELLGRFLDGADLVIDATAEDGVSDLISRMARGRGIPFMAVHATWGAHGGTVMREVPGVTEGCWMCLEHAMDGETIERPPAAASGGVQPRGCMDPTFTGAGFDLAPVWAAAARMAVATLCRGDGYPDIGWDVQTLRLVEDDGSLVPPTWTTYPLDHNPDCPYCSDPSRAAA